MNKVNILGLEYNIDYIEKSSGGNTNAGHIDFDRLTITIYKDVQSDEHAKITLLHEIIHGITYQLEIEFGENDEKYTRLLARSLYQIINDNIGFTEEIRYSHCCEEIISMEEYFKKEKGSKWMM